ncbi:hypothetical protein Leryth_006938 [Lithospermum erythrorhizon]|nr:hypothetical protein Leryth_006938 [Lithospermum erythrorhizon]
MPFSPEKFGVESPLQRSRRWSNLWLKNKKVLNNVLFNVRLQKQQSSPKQPIQPQPNNQKPIYVSPKKPNKAQDFVNSQCVIDKTSLLPDQILLQILSKLPKSQRNSNSLVSKRWLNLQGRLVRSIKVLDWDFLKQGRIFYRFPNLVNIDIVNGCLFSPRNCSILVSNEVLTYWIDSDKEGSCGLLNEGNLVVSSDVDLGLKILVNGYPNLRKMAVMNASEMGLLNVAEECPILQELELHRCNDQVLRGIGACSNLQILKLIGNVEGLYGSVVSDVGLTILAQGCSRLVKLELSGCEGGFEGIKAIGQCCLMLEELILAHHRMEDGWLPALSYCENLKTLRFLSCKSIDNSPGSDENLGFCQAIERLHLEKCQLRDKRSVRALFRVCQGAREIVVKNCWGFQDDMFRVAAVCRRVKYLSLEGCSLLTVEGLESVLPSCLELQSLRVISCNNIKESEVTPALSTLFSSLKELRWWPDTKSSLSSALTGTSLGKRGHRFLKKTCDWKSLPGI